MKNMIKVPKILLPNKDIDLSKWSVVACDQYTSEKEYWEQLKDVVSDAPSSLNIILPEVYLRDDMTSTISKINKNMDELLNSDFFTEVESFILVKRTQSDGNVRLGLMLSVDLEAYEYTTSNNAPIKATEMTVVDRLPVRIEVRQNASLEIPHIMLLMDDAEGEIIEKLYADSDDMEKLYDFDLNMSGGNVVGYKISDNEAVLNTFNDFMSHDRMIERYSSDDRIVFAVGDGNHSLATAKECWNNIKKTLTAEEILTHPARFALCELVNLHDESLVFEPIHRLLIGAGEDFVTSITETLTGEARIRVRFNENCYSVAVSANPSDAIKDIQDFIDNYKLDHPEIVEDYIHGDTNLRELVKKHDAVGVFMPTISKDGFFDYVVRRGVLPRKSFSMGEANDKRYYLEAKKIIK